MSRHGGIYEGPDGVKLYGNGGEIERVGMNRRHGSDRRKQAADGLALADAVLKAHNCIEGVKCELCDLARKVKEG